MTDLAVLGIRFESQGAESAEKSLSGLERSAREAERATDSLALAARGLSAGADSMVDPANRAVLAFASHERQANAARFGTQQLGYQLNDLGTQISAGINPMVALNQQLGQIGFAMSQMQGKAASVGAFLAGPWGAAITIGGAVLSSFVIKILEQNKALDDAANKLRDEAREAETARLAKEAFAASADGFRDAVRDMNAELTKAITSTRQSEIATLNAAKANQQKTLAVREQLQAELELRKTLAEAGLQTAQQGNTRGEMAALNLPQLQRDLEAAKAALAKNATDIVAAQQAIRNASVPVAQRYAEEMSTSTGRITRQYDEMRDAAITAAVGNDQLTASLGSTLLNIEKQRQAAMDADKATGRTRRGSSGQNEYERLIDGAREYIAAQQIEREQMGMTTIERERAESYRRADEIATKGQTAASIALAAEIKREADALAGVRGEYEKAEEAKRGTEGLQGMLTQLERQAQLIGASSEAQALLNTEWAISDLQIKEMSPEMQLLIDRIRLLARGNEAARTEQDRYNDSLRLTLDLARQTDDIMRDAASGFADAFGDAGKSIGGVLTSMTGLNARMAQYDERRRELQKMERDGIPTTERQILLERERAAATAGAYGDMISAAKGYFKEGSDGYRILLAIEQVYRVQQMIGAIQAMAMGEQETGLSLINSARKAMAYGVEAVANAYRSIPYPFNIAAVAATVAGLAAFGIKLAGGSGGDKGAANDNHEVATQSVRAAHQQNEQAQHQSATVMASARLVEVRVTADREGLNAYVVDTAERVSAPMAMQAGMTAFQAMKADQATNQRRASRRFT